MDLIFKKVNTLPAVLSASTAYMVKRTEADLMDLYVSDGTGASARRVINKEDIVASIAASGSAADLTTARTIATTGDATWSVSFDGSANVTAALTLANSGVIAGTYPVVTVDAKGRVTAGRALTATEIPSIPGSKLNSDITVNTTGTAAKLTTARSIAASGDATWSVSFDGSANATAAITLAASGVAAGTYPKVTVDTKGRVTAGASLVEADIPSLSGSKITSALSVNTSGNAATATALATARTINGVLFNGSTDITINAVDATPRIAVSEKGIANGVASLDSTGKVPSSQLPGYVDDILEYANLAALPATGTAGILYVALDTNLLYRWSGTAYVLISSGAGVSDSAIKLQTTRSIAASGDATWSVSFDGSANATAALTLANSGVAAGTYPKVTVDAKGRVTAGASLVEADIPSLSGSKITSALTVNTSGSAATLTTARSISITGDATWTTSFNGSANVTAALTLANSGVAAATYGSAAGVIPVVTVNAKGLVTGVVNTNITSLPSGASTPDVRRSVTTGITAAGTDRATAAVISADINVIAAAAVGTGVVLPSAAAGKTLKIINETANAVKIYPALSQSFNGQAADAIVTLNPGSLIEVTGMTATRWATSQATQLTGSNIETGSIPNTDLANSSMTLAGTAVVLGGALATWPGSAVNGAIAGASGGVTLAQADW